MREMPKKGLYLVLTILGFLLGIIWGALSIGPYNKMKAAIEANDAAEAWLNAGKIKKWFMIGLVINILMFIGRMAQAA